MTFEPAAWFDPNALEAAVSRVDFTPTGVAVWLRGELSGDDLPAVGTDEVAAWLVNEGTGQRFLLVASDDTGKAALPAARRAPPGSIILYGTASRAGDAVAVRVQVEGSGEDE